MSWRCETEPRLATKASMLRDGLVLAFSCAYSGLSSGSRFRTAGRGPPFGYMRATVRLWSMIFSGLRERVGGSEAGADPFAHVQFEIEDGLGARVARPAEAVLDGVASQ